MEKSRETSKRKRSSMEGHTRERRSFSRYRKEQDCSNNYIITEQNETYTVFSPKVEPPATMNKSWGDIMDEEDEKRRKREERERRRQGRPPRNETKRSSTNDRSKEKSVLKERTNYKSEKVETRPPRPKESNLNRLRSRQRQIDIGKETVGYKMYVQDVTRKERTPDHPWTPDKYTLCSTRSWQGVMRIWRRKLHYWDPSSHKADRENFLNVSASTKISEDMVDMREIDNSLDIDDGASSEYSSAPSTQEIMPENFDDFENDDIYDFPMTF